MKNKMIRHIYGLFVLSALILSAGCFENPAEFRRALTGEKDPIDIRHKNQEFCGGSGGFILQKFDLSQGEVSGRPLYEYYFMCCSLMEGGC
jgi:hypothetical protein